MADGVDFDASSEWAEQVHAAQTPAWAKETFSDEILPFLGKRGLPEPWCKRKGPLGSGVAGIDRWQANHFVVCRKETAEFLNSRYTRLEVGYQAGTLPTYEKVVAEYTSDLKTDREKALALLTKALPRVFMHPTMPPLGPACRPNRALDDEALLQSGTGFCNEQARVFVRLCQVAKIPARMVYLFYSCGRGGHTVAEFYADSRWAMADASWFSVFPSGDGHLLSAVECHDSANGKLVAKAYFARFQELLKIPDEELVGRHFPGSPDDPDRAKKLAAAAKRAREGLQSKTLDHLMTHLGQFGLLNYPLPEQAKQ